MKAGCEDHARQATLDSSQFKEKSNEPAITADEMMIEGKKEAITEFVGLLDTLSFWFNIVTP